MSSKTPVTVATHIVYVPLVAQDQEMELVLVYATNVKEFAWLKMSLLFWNVWIQSHPNVELVMTVFRFVVTLFPLFHN